MPSLREEKKLWRKGYKRVTCLDEAGRGPLCGPVVACAVMIKNPKHEIRPQSIFNRLGRISNLKLRDSKKLTAKAREKLYKTLTSHPGVWWGIGRVSEKIIDRINILEATKLAMKKAIEKLDKKPDFLILDGNFKIDSKIPQKSIVKADEKVFSCAAASIIAKVTRDRIMRRYNDKFPGYEFDRHKGYPTKSQIRILKKYGKCGIHRNSFHYRAEPHKAGRGGR